MAQPLRDEHVHTVVEREILGVAFEDGHAIREAVVRHELACHLDDVRLIDGVDVPCATARGQHREDPGAGADVEHAIAFGHDLLDCSRERVRSASIGHHETLKPEIAVVLEVGRHATLLRHMEDNR
ncbi:MAG: hypothetical protein QM784_35440 [Polyangiaceae bacterium]